MSWIERFVTDAERVLRIPRERLEEFIKCMLEGPDRIEQWVDEAQLSSLDFLTLTAMYAIYKAEDRVVGMLSSAELRVDEAVGLASVVFASALNALPPEDRKLVLAQFVIATALQLDDQALKDSLTQYAALLVDEALSSEGGEGQRGGA
ncbi:MAG: hypothetical protein LM577_05365 [Thermoproteaceae archaeon]|jgi:hypothetical protein|nr:hypothetical protein [Thermoproteaceae archaeon]